MVTIRTVAEEAGVSFQTVSAVLSGRAKDRRIAVETQVRVRDAARRLGYQHNALARSLRAGKTNAIGVVGQGYPRMHHTMRVESTARALAESGYQALIQNVAWQGLRARSPLEDLLSLRVDGLLVEAHAGSDSMREMLLDLARRRFPMVRYDLTDDLPCDLVTIDREHGVHAAVTHLFEQGHRRVAILISNRLEVPVNRERLQGYRRAHEEWGVPLDDARVVGYPTQEQFPGYRPGYAAMQTALRLDPRPTALVASDDQVAIGALRAAMEAGVRVPEDFAIVGFVGFLEAEYCPIPLSTVAFPHDDMAREAVRLLRERLDGAHQDPEPRVVTLKPELVVRRSSSS